jgi:hypothetical protein
VHDRFVRKQPAQQLDVFIGDPAAPRELLAEVFVLLLAVSKSQGVGHATLADDVDNCDLLGEPNGLVQR